MNSSAARSNVERSQEVGIVDSLNIVAIFTMFLKEAWLQFLETTAKYYLFSAALGLSVLNAVLAARQDALNKLGPTARPAIEILAAVGIGVAVTIGFVGNVASKLASPLIFAGVMGMKALYHLGTGISDFVSARKSRNTGDMESASKHKMSGIQNLIGFTISIGLGIAVIGAMYLTKPLYAIAGVIGGAVSTIVAVVNRFFSKKDKKPAAQLSTPSEEPTEPLLSHDLSDSPTNRNTLDLSKRLNQAKTSSSVNEENKSDKTPKKNIQNVTPLHGPSSARSGLFKPGLATSPIDGKDEFVPARTLRTRTVSA